jgi:hypothetical protein
MQALLIRKGRPDFVVSDCSLAGLQIQQGVGQEPLHPIQVVERAYGDAKGMKKLTVQDLTGLSAYARLERSSARGHRAQEKPAPPGRRPTDSVFEDRKTILFQIQEILTLGRAHFDPLVDHHQAFHLRKLRARLRFVPGSREEDPRSRGLHGQLPSTFSLRQLQRLRARGLASFRRSPSCKRNTPAIDLTRFLE